MFDRTYFKGGITLRPDKEATLGLPIEQFASSSRLFVPLLQHKGIAAVVAVKRGDTVVRGQMIGDAVGTGCAAVHSPVCGTVLSIGKFPHPGGSNQLCIEIENNGSDNSVDPVAHSSPWQEAAPGEIMKVIAACGVVGMGGEGAPTNDKLTLPSDKPIECLIVNALECEPGLCTDHRLLIEKVDEIVTGAAIIKKVLSAKRVLWAVDKRHNADYAVLKQKLQSSEYNTDMSLVPLRNIYPLGNEHLLARRLMHRPLSATTSTANAKCIVQNVSTLYAVWDAVCNGMPLTRRVVTIHGPAVAKRKNLWVDLGTQASELLTACEYKETSTTTIVFGSSMRGIAQSSLNVPVIKTSRGIYATDAACAPHPPGNCIRCGTCAKVCSFSLTPSMIALLVGNRKFDQTIDWGIDECIECGCCSYVCPANLDLAHFIKLGKHQLNRKRQSRAV